MTSYTICPESQDMLGGKRFVNRQMTIGASGLIKGRNETRFMAVCTGISLMRLQREPSCIMVKRYLLPSTGIVAGDTLRAIGSIMSIICRVTGGTILRSAFEDPVLMTALTSHGRVLTIEVEGKFGVIHLSILPAFGSMASRAIGSKLTIVVVICGMAGDTFLRSYL